MTIATENDPVLLIGPRGKRFMLQLRAGQNLHTHMGIIEFDDLIGQPLGRAIESHLGKRFLVLEPSTHDLILHLRRKGQIIYPKDTGYILLKMNIHNGRKVVEAGTGSGGLTLALAKGVAPEGRVFSYENRADMQQNAKKNLKKLGLESWVEFKQRDIEEGFDETEVDALFLDVRIPWKYLSQAYQALKSGGFFGSLVPTTNQVSHLIAGLENHGFEDIDVEELLVRQYKPVAERLRPDDTMVGHTGYLIFARKIVDPGSEKTGRLSDDQA